MCKVTTYLQLQVVLSAMILSECVYKLVDVGPADSAKAASTFVSQLPPGLVSLQHMQSVAATVPHRLKSLQKCCVHSLAHSVFLSTLCLMCFSCLSIKLCIKCLHAHLA